MNYHGKKVLIMGLGLHGGGLQSAMFLLKCGAEVTVTDLREEEIFRPTIEQLDSYCAKIGSRPVRYILGKHETEDFKKADIVVKNPAVRPNSPYLQAAKQIETDISLFLTENPARLSAVTGTKGKSGTSAALYHILENSSRIDTESNARKAIPKTTHKTKKVFLGGNITVSPLTFLDELTENEEVVLELSSFQLGDLKGRVKEDGSPLLKPAAAILTAIMADHLDRYASMKEYIDDKRNIYREQDENCVTIAGDDDWGKSFRAETKGRPLVYTDNPHTTANPRNLGIDGKYKGISGGWIEGGKGYARLLGFEGISEETALLVSNDLLVQGEHQKFNLLAAALAAYSLGYKEERICYALSDFKGVEHRLELFHEANGIRFYNDSAATIPEAAAACVDALGAQGPLVLVTGGTDKNLDFIPLLKACAKVEKIILLAGTGSEKLTKLLTQAGIDFNGPYDNLEKVVSISIEKARKLQNESQTVNVALSPGCASFGMFLNEFDRGRKWKEAVLNIVLI